MRALLLAAALAVLPALAHAQSQSTFFAPSAINTDQCKTPVIADFGLTGLPFAGGLVAGGWRDKDCERLKEARMLKELGYHDAAVQVMCQAKDVREAMATAGTPCAAQHTNP